MLLLILILLLLVLLLILILVLLVPVSSMVLAMSLLPVPVTITVLIIRIPIGILWTNELRLVLKRENKSLKSKVIFFFVRVNDFVLLFYNLLFCRLFIYLFFMQSLREIKN